MIKEKREKKKANNNLTNNSVATSSSNNTNDMTPSTEDEQVPIKTEQDDETKKIKEEPGEDKCHSPHNEKPTDLPDIKTEDLLNDPGNPGDGNSDLLDSKHDLMLPDGTMCGGEGKSIQPLQSNVINKQQPQTMEAQYMQQQSQIFVFSTQLANKAAEGVLGGQYPSIISYHCSQPKTKKYLEKHPLKINQFNRQNSNQWLNTLAHMKKGPMKGQMGPRDGFKSNMMGMGPGHMMGPNNMGMYSMGPGPGGMMGPGPRHGGMGPGGPMHSGPMHGGPMHSGPGGPMHPGPGGPMHSGPGGQMHSGQGGPMHSGPGGPMHSGPGGPIHSGSGGQMHSGPGGPMHSGPGGPMHSGPGGPGSMGPGNMNSGPGCIPSGMNSGPDGMNSGPPGSGGMNPCMGNPRMPWNQGNMPMENFMMDSCGNNMGPGGPMKPGGPQGHMIGGPNQFMMNRAPNPNNAPNNSNSNNSNMIPSLDDFNDDALEFNQHASLSRVKVPDEDLTPQQRQHREEQLATLRKMHELLFSRENQPNMPQNPNGGPNQNMGDPSASQGQMMPGAPPTSTASSGGGASRMDDMLNSLGDSDWQKMQIPFFDERNKKDGPGTPENNKGRGGAKNQKSQGPPPPYHQATRSASVPVSTAVPSPGPGSPNNPTSNLSLPSPRTCSALGLNSPDSRQSPSASHSNLGSPLPPRSHNPSNNGSPVSNKTHPSPSTKKDLSSALSNEFSPAGHSDPEDSMFSRSLQVLAQDQKNSKEPDLMSVPSPQHIQNFNTFEGQELTIQKQPNTSLKESSSTTSPSQSVPTLDNNTQEVSGKGSPSNPLTPTSIGLTSSSNDFPPISSADSKMPPTSRFNCPSPQQNIGSDSRFPPQNNFHPGSLKTGPGMGSPFMNISPPPNSKQCGMVCDSKDSNFFRIGPDHIPLNPDVNMERKPVHFDPISSLAQMSQQLTSAVGGSPGNMMGPGGPHPHSRMGFNGPGGPGHMHMMQMNDLGMCGPDMRSSMMMGDGIRMFGPDMNNPMGPGRSMSPKMGSYCGPGGPGMRPGGPGPGPGGNMYSGANVQVKANAPNTISYLPTRPQGPDPGPRGQPNLDFLQRFPNPLSNLDSKVPTHKYQYFPNMGGGGGGMCDMVNCNTPPGMMGPRGPNPNMMYPGPNMGPKGPPGLAPDASQPLPPSMGQTNLKNSNYIGPTTADPNYAQQFHNFQQQLYATSSRNQMPGPGGPGLPPPQTMPSQHQFFMNK
uniref:Protein BCL9 homolog n=1 Tax=Cacopsylla melanoneura TaxID=428564 RepID=A0A8D8PVR7_9HEMI